MRVTYIRLENVAGLLVGSDRDMLEIDFSKSKNKIISIQGRNGIGKTVLISSIHPFAYVTSLDERSTLSYIRKGMNGYKEIHYVDGEDTYIIKHYFKASKDTHTVKSYFMKNGEELNDSGNVTSFNALVEQYFDLTQEMMRLIRIGTNVNSFISLSPAKRKEYIGKLIDEINAYLIIYKKINEDIRVVKALIQVNSTNLYNCHITDPVVEDSKLDKLYHEIKKRSKERDGIVSRIAKLNALMQSNDMDQMKSRYQELDSALKEFERVEERSKHLEHVTMDDLVKKRNDCSNQLLNIKSQANSYRILIDNTMAQLEKLEVTIQKISSDRDIQTLTDSIQTLKQIIQSTPNAIKSFQMKDVHSDEIQSMIAKLSSLNDIAQMIISLGKKPLDIYLRLRRSNTNVEKWLAKQAKQNLARVNHADIKGLMDQVFQDDQIITPNCATEFEDCPYYRFADVITTVYNEMEKDSIDDETLRYIKVIHVNMQNLENTLYMMREIQIPDKMRDDISVKSAMERIEQRLPFFDLTELIHFGSIVKEYEIYCQQLSQLAKYEEQIAVYQKAGIGSQLQEKKRLQEQLQSMKDKLNQIMDQIHHQEGSMHQIDEEIGLVMKRDDARKYRKLYESELKSIHKVLGPLERANEERRELEFQLKQITTLIETAREEHRVLQNRIAEYNKLVQESLKLNQMNKDLNLILTSVGTKKGIPVFYMKKYLQKIQTMSNDLLDLIYHGDFQLAKFNVTPDTFEVPYIKNGAKLPDIKYASQSELALATMALSFALAHRASAHYNIILLDEIDAGLDEQNRTAFMKMLYMQMDILHAEQVFIISHNLSQMINVPMDAIRLSDIGVKSKLQNVIYE